MSFARECDPEADAATATSAIWYAAQLGGGPTGIAIERIQAIERRVAAEGQGPAVALFVAECRALALCRHGRLWVSLMQKFGQHALIEELMTEYLQTFVPSLARHLDALAAGAFRLGEPTDQVMAWTAPLDRMGTVWTAGLARGEDPAKLMETLWLAV